MKVLEKGVLSHSEKRNARSCGHFQHVNINRHCAKNLTIELTAVNIANESTPVRGKPGAHVSTECGLLLIYIIISIVILGVCLIMQVLRIVCTEDNNIIVSGANGDLSELIQFIMSRRVLRA